MELIEYKDIQNKDGFYFTVSLGGVLAQTAANFGFVFTARHPLEILRICEIHETAGTDAGAVTLDVVKCTSGTAISSGTSILAATFNLKSTANTPINKEGLSLNSYRRLKENESLALKTTGTLTALAGVCITIYCQNFGKGSYK